jgi:transposase-like protein
MRNVSDKIAKKADKKIVSRGLSAVLKADTTEEAKGLYHEAIEQAYGVSAGAGELLEEAEADALTYLAFPRKHWVKIRTNNVQERANREIKRRTKVVSVFPSKASAMRLVGAFLAELDEEWMGRAYISPVTFADEIEAGADFPVGAPAGAPTGKSLDQEVRAV